MNTWWWSTLLIRDGHRFVNAEWRCVDCRRMVFDMLQTRPPCRSPWDDGYLFVGGPFDGRWINVPEPAPPEYEIELPIPRPMLANDVVNSSKVTYVRKRFAIKTEIHAYVFEG